MVFAMHNRRFVLNQRARNKMTRDQAEEMKARGHEVDVTRRVTMDARFIQDRTRIIQLAIDARRERYPDETPYVYKPHLGEEMPPDRELFRKAYSLGPPIDV